MKIRGVRALCMHVTRSVLLRYFVRLGCVDYFCRNMHNFIHQRPLLMSINEMFKQGKEKMTDLPQICPVL